MHCLKLNACAPLCFCGSWKTPSSHCSCKVTDVPMLSCLPDTSAEAWGLDILGRALHAAPADSWIQPFWSYLAGLL